MPPPQASQCHHKEYLKKIKNKTTTDVVVIDDIRELVTRTPFQKVEEESLIKFVKKYGVKIVFDSLDMLIETYKQSDKTINDPTAILASGLSNGVTPPAGYVPHQERVENERKAKERAEQQQRADVTKRKADEEACNKKAALFDALHQRDKEIWLDRAKSELSPAVRNSKQAVRSMAVELYNKDSD